MQVSKDHKITFETLSINHAEKMFCLWSDFEAVKFTNWPFVATLEECRERLKRVIDHYAKNSLHFGPYIIRLDDGEFAGVIGADESSPEQNEFEVWYYIPRNLWRKGIATTALTKLIQEMKISGRVSKVCATAVVDNPASWGMLERFGFMREEQIKDGHQKHGLSLDLLKYVRSL